MIGMRQVGKAGFICALPLVALLVPHVAYAATSPTAPAKPAAAAPAGTRNVWYSGVRVSVPLAWPVIDLRVHPSACVRLDRSALYLGSPGAQSNCPAHAVGRADTIWLKPAVAGGMGQLAIPSTPQVMTVGTLAARVGVDPVSHNKQAQFVAAGVEADATWGASSSSVDRVLASAVSSSTPATPVATPSVTAPTKASAAAAIAPPLAAPSAPSPASIGGASFSGYAFDTCAAPSASTMRAWLSSPYRGVGVYIGGSQRACGDGNLSASWVAAVKAMGWRLIPTYVGPQAPCVNQSGLGTISASSASAQGIINAADAVTQARRFGMDPGTPIYYDMEGYSPSGSCSNTVSTFISGWTRELHVLGYQSGAYGSPGSLMTDMSTRMHSAGFTAPDDVWFAHWNGLGNTTDQASYPGFPDAYWPHHRVHQYSGNLFQSWGGAGVSIDADRVDAGVAGVASSPAKATSPPYEVAFQANTGNLWSEGSTVHGDWGTKIKAGTSPSITGLPNGGYEMAFQSTSSNLVTIGSAGNRIWPLGLRAGTSPSITGLANGTFEVAFQANSGSLWSVGWHGHGDWGKKMKAGTSPSITALTRGYELAFQSSSSTLVTIGSAGNRNWPLGLRAGTSPSMTGLSNGTFEVAFQANSGSLWSEGWHGHGDWGKKMMGGTSPSITALSSGYELAFQASSTCLTTIGSAGNRTWPLGMRAGTSPSITGLSNGSFEAAFQANTGILWSVGSVNKGPWRLAMMARTSPSIGR